jgi:hypothetical protein
MPDALSVRFGNKTVNDFVNMYRQNQLNLEPGFQRQSVWRMADRVKLIESILQGYPMPSVFLYKNMSDGQLRFDVIDGKQRLESILMFLGHLRGNRFSIWSELDPEAGPQEWDWRALERAQHGPRLLGYEIQTVELETDELSVVRDVFVRINSTGMRLTSAEKRHARFYTSTFLKQASKVARAFESYFIEYNILTRGQISRMKHVELVSELLASFYQRQPVNKKRALDQLIGGTPVDGRSLGRAVGEVVRALRLSAGCCRIFTQRGSLGRLISFPSATC